jgi:muconolactone delta-isomerase
MPSLRDLQEEMRRHIVSPTRLPDAGKDVYRYAYGARLAGALASNYPVLAQRCGDAEFSYLAREYLAKFPSSHYNIRWYGGHLWRLLDGAYADLARMEWALGLAFDASDASPLTWSRLNALPVEAWSELPVALHPSTHVLYMSWSAEKLWQGVEEPQPRIHDLLVWRKDLQAQWRIAGHDEALALRALRRSGTLERACEALPETAAAQVGTWFAGWVQEGMLTLREPA